jgi:catechol 2,3-dioxygenase
MTRIPAPLFRPPFDVTRASHVVLLVRDLAASRAFYVDTIGLIVSDENSHAIYLRGIEEVCHHSLVLKQAPQAGCQQIGMRVQTDDDLDLAAAYLGKAGLSVEWVEVPYQRRTLRVVDPSGIHLEFCVSMDLMPRMIMQFDRFRGACPQRLDHFQVHSQDVEVSMAFYMRMGFRLSEYIVADGEDDIVFAFLQRKGNPHDIVFTKGSGPRLHHFAFVAPEVHHLMDVCDLCARNGFGASVEYGPGRHFGPGLARFVYLRDPDGHRVEFFNTHYQTIDIEEEPVRWRMSDVFKSGRWGPPPPTSWLTQASEFRRAID